MARARNIKPGFFTNDELVELSFAVRLLFIGLWTIADKEGRLSDRPKKIKMEIFPADDVDVDRSLNELQSKGFVRRYTVGGVNFIQIVNWAKHQNPHLKEAASSIPAEITAAPEIPGQAPEIPGQAPVVPELASEVPALAGLIVDSGFLIPDTGLCDAAPEALAEPASHITAVDLSIAMRKGGINCQPANPVLIELAAQGVTPEIVLAACERAKELKPGESLPVSYIAKMIQTWARQARDLDVQGARASPARPEKFDGLAYVNRNRKNSNERTIELDATGEPVLEMVRAASET